MNTIYTVGHSNHAIEVFIGMLQAHGIDCIMDVRSAPGSRYNPQFGQLALRDSLADAGIDYVHVPMLGGHRKGSGPSINLGWRNTSFRNYADYMQTDSFNQGMAFARARALVNRCALMCCEAVPWRCHRSLIADSFVAHDWRVLDIFSATQLREHQLTKFARVDGVNVTYPLLYARDDVPGQQLSMGF